MDTVIDFTLEPHWWNTIPEISYGIDDRIIDTVVVDATLKLQLDLWLDPGTHKLWVYFHNKNYDDCRLDQNLDMAVEITAVSFEGMTFDRFKWAGFFYPDYPADYPDKKPVIESATYLGWNGRWELPFTTPIFTWIHRLENLGWLYEP